MDLLDNPQLFENSSVVQKKSEKGVFSNKRLLVIKTGYLYYFSNVPKGYKSHVSNILNTFTDLPKSSIEIKNILDIRLESAKSPNLIIKFYKKDMINKQDLRKSIDTQFYSMPNKKPNTETNEWNFAFTTVLQCRLWYNALMKLKDYFKNLQNKFCDFVANFDPKRTSVSINGGETIKDNRSQSDVKHLLGNSSKLVGNSQNNNNKNQSSSLGSGKEDQKRHKQPIKFDASKFITPLIEKHSSSSSQNDKLSQKLQISPIKEAPQIKQQKQTQKPQSSQIQPELEKSSSSGAYHQNISKKIQPEIPQHYQELQNNKRAESFIKGGLKESHLIEPIDEEDQFKMRQMEDDIREQVKIEIQQKVREDIQLKVKEKLQKEKQEQMKKYQQQVQLKEIKIRQLETEIHIKHLANMEEQRRIEEEKRQLQLKIIEEQQKLNHAKVDFEKKLKLQKLQTKTSNYEQTNTKYNTENHQNHKTQRKWLQGEEDEYEASYQDQYYQQEGKTQMKKDQNHNLTNPTYNPSNKIYVNQFSVQTDEEDFTHNHQSHNDSFQPNFNFSKELSLSKDLNLSKQTKIRNSFFSDHGTTQRNIFANDLLRIEDGLNNSCRQKDSKYDQLQFQNYNYFVEIAKIHQQNITPQEKFNRQIKIINYVDHMKQKAISLALQYITMNNPRQCQTFQKGLLSFQLACAPGKIMNIGGQNKLIYSNKVHQNLKRTFKIYQNLQTQIIKVLKYKNTFPVRVPLCTLIEYRGYTILAKVEICTDEVDLSNKDKYLKHLLSPTYFSLVQLSKTIRSSDNQSQFYMIKVLKPIKLTNEDKNSQVLKCQTDLNSFINSINTARKNNVSLCYQKLLKEYEEDKQAKHSNNKTQYLKNQFQLLKVIKLMRELKKIYKSMEPFDEMQQLQEDYAKTSNSNKKSYFVQFLLSNPSQLLSLIPSETNLSKVNTQCGYFYSIVEFFMGIRVGQPVKSNLNTTKVSYEILPVSRSYHFPSLSTHQHIDRVQKHLSHRNIQAAINCLNLVKKISTSNIQPLLLETKILLKKKQYSQAISKMISLRETLSLHDLRNIELNAYLIECYVFMGLETQVLKQIRSSIDYVDYMFGGRKNVFETNLHLLMAQTLLRLGNLNEAIQMYKSLIKYDKVEKGTVLISYAQTLVKNLKIDPNQAIPFLLQFVDQINDPDKKIDLLHSVAKLYTRTKRIDKRVYYLQKAFNLCLNCNNYRNLLDLYDQLAEQTGTEQKRQMLFKDLVSQVDGKFWLNETNTKKFNTINLYQALKSKDSDQNKQVALMLDQLSNAATINQTKFSSIEVLQWSQIGQFATFLQGQSKGGLMNKKEEKTNIDNVLKSINVQSLIKQLQRHNTQTTLY